MNHRLLAILSTLLLVAIATPNNCAAGTRDNNAPRLLRLRPGASASFGDLRIDFLKVVSDSRCPRGAMCGIAGNAAVELRLTDAAEPPQTSGHAPPSLVVTLNSNLPAATATTVRWRVAFASLTPLPSASRTDTTTTTMPSNYLLTLRVSAVRPAAAAGAASLPPGTSPDAGAATAAPGAAAGAVVMMPIGPGKSVTFHGYEVRFKSVLEDSRCPSGARCIWAGNTRVSLAVSGPDIQPPAGDLELNSMAGDATVSIGRLSIEFVSLEPYPGVKPEPNRPSQTLTLRLTYRGDPR